MSSSPNIQKTFFSTNLTSPEGNLIVAYFSPIEIKKALILEFFTKTAP